MNDELTLRIWNEMRTMNSHLGDIAHNTSRIATTLEKYEDNHTFDYTSDIHSSLGQIDETLRRIYSVQDERL